MMAVVASFTDNQLSIVGDSAADTVVVSTVDVGGVAQVTVNGQSVGAGVDASAVTSIFANLGGGNDTMNLSTLDLMKFSGLTDGSIEIRGGAGNDTLVGSPLGDILKGEDGNDSLTGGAGNDQLIGGNGNDTLIGGAGDDTLDGGAGDDMYSFSGSTDLGSDTVVQAASGNLDTLGFGSLGGAIVIDISMTTPQVVRAGVLTLTLSDANGIDNVQGTAYDDVILGNAGGNSLMGTGGNDYLWGRGGNDWLDGGSGNDTLYGGDGNDTLLGKGGNDSLYGHAGDDTLNGNEGNDYLSGDEGDDTYIVTNYGTKTIGGAASGDSNVLNLAGQVLAAPLNLASTSVQAITASLFIRFTDPNEINWIPGAGDNGEHAGGLYEAGYYSVPGVEGTSTAIEFIYGGEIAAYNNSVYVYDATGNPSNPAGTLLFVANSPNPPKTLTFPAGHKLGFYILQNNVDGMNGNASTRFYADDAKNVNDDDPGAHSHVHAYDLEPGLLQLSWEDLFYQRPNPLGFIQDTDFNDMYIGVRVTDYTAVDLDVDSKNDSGYAVPDNNAEEDSLEEDSGKGKYLIAQKNGVSGVERVPLVVRLGSLPESGGTGRLTFSFGAPVQVFKEKEGDAQIHDGQAYSLAELGFTKGANVLYMQVSDGAAEYMPITVSYAAEGLESRSDTVHVAPVSLSLEEVQFSATNPNEFFDNVILDDGKPTSAWGYDWRKSFRFGGAEPFFEESPVVYKRGATMVAERRIAITAPDAFLASDDSVKVLRGTPSGASRYEFVARSDGAMGDASYAFERIGGRIVVRDAAAEHLNTAVEYRDLIIPWQFSVDGGTTFVNLGSSTNQLYSLLQTPLDGVEAKIRHTSVHVSTVAAMNRITEDGVLIAVWDEFKDRSVRKAPVRVGDEPGAELVYTHFGFATDNFNKFFLGVEGTCQSWSRFLADALALHGIGFQVMDIRTNDAQEARPAPSDPAYSYLQAGGIDVGRVPAQGSGGEVYTTTTFSFHSVLVVASRPTEIFDPSYGRLWAGTTLADALSAWEIESLVSTEHKFSGPEGVVSEWVANRPGINDVKLVEVAFEIV